MPEYRELTKAEAERYRHAVDVVVVTATRCETNAVHRAVQPPDGESASGKVGLGARTYVLGKMGGHSVAHVQTSEYINLGAASDEGPESDRPDAVLSIPWGGILSRRLPVIVALILMYGLASSSPALAVGQRPPFATGPPSQPTAISGRVIDEAGAPVMGAWVTVYEPFFYLPMDPPIFDSMWALTDTNGCYAIYIDSPGVMPMSVFKFGFAPQGIQSEPILPGGATTQNFVLRQEQANASLVLGTVVKGAEGATEVEHLSGATVEIFDTVPSNWMDPVSGTPNLKTTSAADGSFIFPLRTHAGVAIFKKPGYYESRACWSGPGLVTFLQGTLYPVMTQSPEAETVVLSSKRGVATYTLGATLNSSPNTPARGAKIYLQRKGPGGKWTAVAKLKTNKSGKASRRLKTKKHRTVRYRWYAPRTGSRAPATTPVQKVTVK